ncbi:origin recognition complex subunit 5 C-terminus-domain-containing protein [Lanmaoa asiatica]|nr:hypothetical protein J3R83DRAFT_7766 [Lanmaoa asiatica]KAH0826024.1 origin recognition complex subunit 5 C-terminus-domain-containing protein [Lanmaoa asiatica]
MRPVISQYEELVRQAEDEGLDPSELEPPGTDGRLRLFKFFLPTFTKALDALYPRLDNATDWAVQNDYDGGQTSTSNREKMSSVKVDHLPRISKFILIAVFVASTNPQKSDLRMFGRGAGERKKRRRKSASPKKGGGRKRSSMYTLDSFIFSCYLITPLGIPTVTWPCDVSIG